MKKRQSAIQIAGFEHLPEGQLLTQFVDFGHDMGAAYERCVGYTKDFHVHDRINLTFPRSASVIKFSMKSPPTTLMVDNTRFLWMPARTLHRQDTRSVIYDNFAIFPTEAVIDEAFGKFNERYGLKAILPRQTLVRRRTALFDALLSEYFTERVLERKKPRLLLDLGFQIFDELLRILFCPKRLHGATEEEQPSELPIARAVRFIEGNLFTELNSKSIAWASHSSVPSLFRKFERDIGMTPRQYIIKRRMEEALRLLKTGEYNVGDVALLVGYQDSAAFSKAFKKLFGVPPASGTAFFCDPKGRGYKV
ncbi:MAG: helix-turn-helix transcriptional regulator [Deltaproteobacteria bacterium]|nr:helix-turn-helix transcriptional regulator [Deltaproteobacteria bacterium]